ncbi:MAG: c-type cytochrome [Planctomycetales bacterium]|nr:c-type cytochrome [Planctomycetales bacterium]
MGCTPKADSSSDTSDDSGPVIELPGDDTGESSDQIDATGADATEPPAGDNTSAFEESSNQLVAIEKDEVNLGDNTLTVGIPGTGPLSIAEIKTWLKDPANHVVLKITLPEGLAKAEAQVSGLDANPMTRAKIELGRQLYFDKRLAKENAVSCADCHHPDEGYGRHTQFGVGINDQTGNRNSPVSYNRIVSSAQFWDGRAASLEEQAIGPIANPIEMGNTHDACVTCLKGIEGYQLQFDSVFPGEGLTIENVGKAIAAFERAIVTQPAPYDYYEFVRTVESQYEKDEIADLKEEDPELAARYQEAVAKSAPMSEGARRGRELFFGKANCTACHAGANFTDEKYHNLGVGMEKDPPDWGRYEVTKQDIDRGAFKTPTLRNIVHSAPYMHDGSQKTLEEVVEWYYKGGHPNTYLSEKMKKLNLTAEEKSDLVKFMTEGLTSDFVKVEQGRLPQ